MHVSIVAFDNGSETTMILDGKSVNGILPSLRSAELTDVSLAKPLNENADTCYLGVMKAGSFDLSELHAMQMLGMPNPHRLPNSDVLRPRYTARDLLQRQAVDWIIDFGCDTTAEQGALYESPWSHVERHVYPERKGNNRPRLAAKWWIHGESRPGLRAQLRGLDRFIVTPEVSKHRIFVWLDSACLPDHQTRTFAVDDD